MKKKAPYIKCDSKIWEYVKPYLLKWGYTYVESGPDWDNEPYLIIDYGGVLGNMTSIRYDYDLDECRELVNVETFLERAAELKNFNYMKNVEKFTKKDLKPGMVIEYADGNKRLVLPIQDSLCFVGIDSYFAGDINTYSNDLIYHDELNLTVDKVYEISTRGDLRQILKDESKLKLLWQREKKITVTMDQIAEKFGCLVEQLQIVK